MSNIIRTKCIVARGVSSNLKTKIVLRHSVRKRDSVSGR